ncbi:MAG: hypothetical protein R2939_02580 [Kofleriaceae bacterium]
MALARARDVEAARVGGGRPPPELVAATERLYPNPRHRSDRGQLPPWGTPLSTLRWS